MRKWFTRRRLLVAIAILGIAAFLALIAYTQLKAYRAKQATAAPVLTCAVNESLLWLNDGWKQLPEARRQEIGRKVREKTMQIELRAGALMCTLSFENRMLHIDNGALWYYRPAQVK